MVGSGTGSGKFDRIRIREKGPDPTESGSATLVSGMCVFGENLDRWMIFKNSGTFFLIFFYKNTVEHTS